MLFPELWDSQLSFFHFLKLEKKDRAKETLSVTIKEGSETKTTSLNISFYEAIQYIVCESEKAYEYLSFRRSIIRIMRTVFTFSIFTPCLYLVYAGIFAIGGHPIALNGENHKRKCFAEAYYSRVGQKL